MEFSLEELLNETVHRGKLPPKELADRLGKNYFTLMRQVNLTDDAASFPVKDLVGLMIAQNDFSILGHLNKACGFLPPVKPPRGFKSPEDLRLYVNEYNRDFSTMQALFYEFMAEPYKSKFEAFEAAARNFMSKTETIRRSAKNNLLNQTEMEL